MATPKAKGRITRKAPGWPGPAKGRTPRSWPGPAKRR